MPPPRPEPPPRDIQWRPPPVLRRLMWKTAALMAAFAVMTGLIVIGSVVLFGVDPDLAAAIALAVTAVPWILLWRWIRRSVSRAVPDQWTCPDCGYDLAASAQTRGVCPECGRAYDWEELQFLWQHVAPPERPAPDDDHSS